MSDPRPYAWPSTWSERRKSCYLEWAADHDWAPVPSPPPPGGRVFVRCVNGDGDWRDMPGDIYCTRCGCRASVRMPLASSPGCESILLEAVLGT